MMVKVLKNKSNKKKVVLYVSGRIDTNTAPELEKYIADKLEGLKEMVLDFTKTDYISSAGLRVLLAAHKDLKKQKGRLIIKNPNDTIEEVFHITGFDQFMNIQGSDDEKKNAQTDEEEDVQTDEEEDAQDDEDEDVQTDEEEDAQDDEDEDAQTDEEEDAQDDEDEDVQTDEEEDAETDESQEDAADDDTEES